MFPHSFLLTWVQQPRIHVQFGKVASLPRHFSSPGHHMLLPCHFQIGQQRYRANQWGTLDQIPSAGMQNPRVHITDVCSKFQAGCFFYWMYFQIVLHSIPSTIKSHVPGLYFLSLETVCLSKVLKVEVKIVQEVLVLSRYVHKA